MPGESPILPAVKVYSRPGCHLCEQLIEELMPLLFGRATLEIENIDTRDDWLLDYGSRVPVVEIAGQAVCQYRLDSNAVLRAIAANSAAISTS